jgi:glutathione S-transferase
MQLYNSPLSPFVARIRIQIYAKGIDVEIVDPPGGHSSDEYHAINFTGKVPALVVDGAVIPESGAIAEFLEERFPEPSMLPGSDLERAQSRVLTEMTTSYLFPALSILFGQMDPATRDEAVLAGGIDELSAKLAWVEHLLDDTGPYALGSKLTLADAQLHPVMFFVARLVPLFGQKDLLEGRPRLTRWWEDVRKHEAVAKVDAEMAAAAASVFGG